MPFDNFYAESDKAARRWWKCFCLAFLLFTGYWSLGFLIFPNSEEDEIITAPLGKFRNLWQATELCANLPKPQGFYFSGDIFSELDNTSKLVSFKYESNRSFEEVAPSYLVWFDSNGWKRVPNDKTYGYMKPDGQLAFIKSNQNVVISYYNTDLDTSITNKEFYTPYYVIYCYQREISVKLFD